MSWGDPNDPPCVNSRSRIACEGRVHRRPSGELLENGLCLYCDDRNGGDGVLPPARECQRDDCDGLMREIRFSGKAGEAAVSATAVACDSCGQRDLGALREALDDALGSAGPSPMRIDIPLREFRVANIRVDSEHLGDDDDAADIVVRAGNERGDVVEVSRHRVRVDGIIGDWTSRGRLVEVSSYVSLADKRVAVRCPTCHEVGHFGVACPRFR